MAKEYIIGDIKFNNPILNASGCWSTNEEQLTNLYNSNLGGIIAKTCTLFSKDGNPEPNYYYSENQGIHLNSKGLPNLGYQFYRNITNKFINKPYIISIAFENYEKLKILLEDYNNYVNRNMLVEINLSCPNLESEIPGYYSEVVEHLLDFIIKLNIKHLNFGLKFPPFLQKVAINEMAKVLNKFSYILKYIVLSNSIPNCVSISPSDGNPVLKNVYGGLSGKLNKYISLSNVMQFSKILNKNIRIVGCGGIDTMEDVLDYLNNGADFVQLASCFLKNNDVDLDLDKINNLVKDYDNVFKK
jgi:dihydroorotate dehydrogenase (fumarate)